MSLRSIIRFFTNSCQVKSEIQQSNINTEKDVILQTDNLNLESERNFSSHLSERISKYNNLVDNVNNIRSREQTLILYPPNLKKVKSTRENKSLKNLESNSQIKSKITPGPKIFEFEKINFVVPSLKSIFKRHDNRIESTQNESELTNNNKLSLIIQQVSNFEFLSNFQSLSKWKNSSKMIKANSFEIKHENKKYPSVDFDHKIRENSKKEIKSTNIITSISVKKNYKNIEKKLSTQLIGAQKQKSISKIKLLEEIKKTSENSKSTISLKRIQNLSSNSQQLEKTIPLKDSIITVDISKLNKTEPKNRDIYTKPIKILKKSNSQKEKKQNLSRKV